MCLPAPIAQIRTFVTSAPHLHTGRQHRPVAESLDARLTRAHVKHALGVGAEVRTEICALDIGYGFHDGVLKMVDRRRRCLRARKRHAAAQPSGPRRQRAREHGLQVRAQALTGRTACQIPKLTGTDPPWISVSTPLSAAKKKRRPSGEARPAQCPSGPGRQQPLDQPAACFFDFLGLSFDGVPFWPRAACLAACSAFSVLRMSSTLMRSRLAVSSSLAGLLLSY